MWNWSKIERIVPFIRTVHTYPPPYLPTYVPNRHQPYGYPAIYHSPSLLSPPYNSLQTPIPTLVTAIRRCEATQPPTPQTPYPVKTARSNFPLVSNQEINIVGPRATDGWKHLFNTNLYD
ncbi:hypothetical protein EYC80_006379 [Monilinia laxa]|uniref:Uncharacterized protein n=1 Tax=Monilinia laxa TaxID=61186 RepID=A0A5N6JRS6_MONLA|nr:hypothetical protein EYC80_006379 [Monilinia laxa]